MKSKLSCVFAAAVVGFGVAALVTVSAANWERHLGFYRTGNHFREPAIAENVAGGHLRLHHVSELHDHGFGEFPQRGY